MPVILNENCTGCGLCVEACGPKSLIMTDGFAVLACPHTCGSEGALHLGLQDDAIHLAWLPFSGERSVGKWSANVERTTIADSLIPRRRSNEPIAPMVLLVKSVEDDARKQNPALVA